MSNAKVETPLHYYAASIPGDSATELVLIESPQRGYLNVRGDSDCANFRDSIAELTGVALPVVPLTFNCKDDRAIYWLGPSEWLLIAPHGNETTTENKLRETLGGHYAITDVSGGYTQITMQGSSTTAVLQKASPYDFHPDVFSSGRCVQTVVAKATALVSKQADGNFSIVVRRSYADYLALWLSDAAREYGVTIQSA